MAVEAYLETVTSALRFLAGHLQTAPSSPNSAHASHHGGGSSGNVDVSAAEAAAEAAYVAAEAAAFRAATDGIPLEAKLAFFNEIRHAYGRSAL